MLLDVKRQKPIGLQHSEQGGDGSMESREVSEATVREYSHGQMVSAKLPKHEAETVGL